MNKLQRCPKCGKNSLWHNSFSNLDECLNKFCEEKTTVSPSNKLGWPGIRISWKLRRSLKQLLWLAIRLILISTTLALIVVVLASVSSLINFQPISSGGVTIAVTGLIAMFFVFKEAFRYRVRRARALMLLMLSVILIAFSWSYMKIESVPDLKDRVEDLFSTKNTFRESVDLIINRIDLKFDFSSGSDNDTGGQPPLPTVIGDISTTAPASTHPRTSKPFSTEYVTVNAGRLIGADGGLIILNEYGKAEDPSWPQLLEFLRQDKTDEHEYRYGSFVCADFAEMLHNNAEAAGIRSAYVCIQLGPSANYPYSGGHALNAFNTTDRGLVFIDDTAPIGEHPSSSDTIVDVKEGYQYIPESLFPEPGWSSEWESMGVVLDVEIVQW
jgi:hypothetical protein